MNCHNTYLITDEYFNLISLKTHHHFSDCKQIKWSSNANHLWVCFGSEATGQAFMKFHAFGGKKSHSDSKEEHTNIVPVQLP